jgi:hypothetical protein
MERTRHAAPAGREHVGRRRRNDIYQIMSLQA